MISIIHLFWIIPLSMSVGAMALLCVSIVFMMVDKRQEQKELEEFISQDSEPCNYTRYENGYI